jgi:outer membrane protein assembly factor BamB
MKFPLSFVNRKQAASFVDLLLAVAPLWLMMVTANTSAYGQTSDDVSHSSAAATSSPADWTQFHRDNMQRWNPYEMVIGVNNAGSLQLKWKNPIGDYFNPIQSSPAVVNGMVYFGSQDASVYALNASTGAKLWSFATGGQVFSSPAVVNGVVYFGSGDNNVYALNASTGAKLWSFATGNSVISSPTVVNGVVYFGSGDNNVYALNATTGAKLWSFATGGAITYSSPAVANGVVYISSLDNNFYALNASTGAKLWSYPAGTIPGSPAVVNGIVCIGSDNNNVYALDATTGILLWSYHALFSVESSPAVANGVVYFGSDAGLVYALNASTGAQLWSYTAGGAVVSSPAVANGVVYVATSTGVGNLYALNATTGAKLWSYATGTNNSSPTIVDGVVYFRSGGQSGGGNIYAFSLGSADLFLRVTPSAMTIHQGDLLTYAFPVWNLGPDNADFEVLNTQVPAGTTFDYIRISGTPGLGTCTTPPYQGTGQIVCHENASMAPNTTWTVRLTVKVTAPSGTVITENAATMADTPDPNMANNTATVSLKVQ